MNDFHDKFAERAARVLCVTGGGWGTSDHAAVGAGNLGGGGMGGGKSGSTSGSKPQSVQRPIPKKSAQTVANTYSERIYRDWQRAKAAAPNSTTPIGDTSPVYNGFPADRVFQAVSIGANIVTGSIFGAARELAMGVMNDRNMTPASGRSFNKNRDNQGATRGMSSGLLFSSPKEDLDFHALGDIASQFFAFGSVGF